MTEGCLTGIVVVDDSIDYTRGMSTLDKWYKDGLHFSCTGCGNCCTGEAGVVWVDDEELELIAEHLGKTIGELRLFHTRLFGNRVSLTEFANSDCTFFDPETRECKVYPVRPRQCRSWPFWNSNLESRRHWQDVQKSCPGAGNGAFVSLEEIERQTAQIDI